MQQKFVINAEDLDLSCEEDENEDDPQSSEYEQEYDSSQESDKQEPFQFQ